jgi:phosphoenolpyruvate carboxylase
MGELTGYADDDLPLREDIRLLGRILGDVIREQHGLELFDFVERVRKTAVRLRAFGNHAPLAEVGKLLDTIDVETAISVVRAFGYFSYLANVAEADPPARAR